MVIYLVFFKSDLPISAAINKNFNLLAWDTNQSFVPLLLFQLAERSNP